MADDPWVELLDESRAREAGASRARTRWLRRAAGEGATLAGALLDLAEGSAVVALATRAGRVHQAEVAAVGADVVVLRPPSGALLLVPLAAVAWVRPVDGPLPLGDREAPAGPYLLDLLGWAAERGDRVVVRFGGDTALTGTVEEVGAALVRLRPDDPGAGARYVSVTSIGEAAVFRSG